MMHGWKHWFWMLAVVCVCAGECEAFSQTSPDSSQNSQIGQTPPPMRGTVVNSVTGEPIYRALVQIGGQFVTLTDHEGHFEFEGLTDATSTSWAMKPGYFSEPGDQHYSSGTQTAGKPFVVKLVPEAVISGTVTGLDGGPLEGIPVQLKVLATSNGLERWQNHQGTTTNSEGQYRFFELQAGKYAIATGFHSEGIADEKNSVAYIPVRYPPLAGTESQSAIAVAPGEHREVNLAPEVQKLYPVTGVVNGYGENRGVTFNVETADGEEISATSRFNARTSEFRLMLPGGSYSIGATAYSRQGVLQSRLQITVPNAPVGGVSFALEPGASIPVEIQTETVNQPADSSSSGGVVASIGGDQSPAAYVSLETGEGSRMSYPAESRGQHGQAGNSANPLLIQNVPPGRYMLQVQPSQGNYYAASADCGGVDLVHEELAIANGVAGCTIRIVLRNDAGKVHVTERSSELDGRSFVSLYPLGNYISRTVQGVGRSDFLFEIVPPGRYFVIAQDRQEELPYRDAEAMRKYAALGQEITVTANAVTTVEVHPAHVEP